MKWCYVYKPQANYLYSFTYGYSFNVFKNLFTILIYCDYYMDPVHVITVYEQLHAIFSNKAKR